MQNNYLYSLLAPHIFPFKLDDVALPVNLLYLLVQGSEPNTTKFESVGGPAADLSRGMLFIRINDKDGKGAYFVSAGLFLSGSYNYLAPYIHRLDQNFARLTQAQHDDLFDRVTAILDRFTGLKMNLADDCSAARTWGQQVMDNLRTVERDAIALDQRIADPAYRSALGPKARERKEYLASLETQANILLLAANNIYSDGPIFTETFGLRIAEQLDKLGYTVTKK